MENNYGKGLKTSGDVIKNPVFIIAFILAAAFVIVGISVPNFGGYMDAAFAWMTSTLGWGFILGATFFVIVTVYLIFSPLGEIKLGEDGEKPEYSTLSWFSMLFSAGMGIGLLFWGVSEPINHYNSPPTGEGGTSEAIHTALQYSFFHWGFHPWAVYAVVACALAYFSYRKNLPMLLSSTLEPMLGRDNLNGFWGSLVNIIGVLATLLGISTSLGLGVMQIGGGLETLFGLPNNNATWVGIVIVVTILAILSTTTGIDKGIKWLSQINLSVAGLLMLIIFIIGPTLFILNAFTHSSGTYFQNLIFMSLGMDATDGARNSWYESWTIFYWAWWIAWSPFVGSFIARVSRGRTIRSFAIGVLLVPTGLSMFWLSVFGGAALYNQHFAGMNILDAVMQDEAQGFFALLSNFPLSGLLISVAMVSVAVFFVTSSDSGTYVIGMLTSKGNPNPPIGIRIAWGTIEGLFAIVLLLAGGLSSLQTASFLGGFPFMLIMLLMVYCLIKALRNELREGSLPVERQRIFAALEDLQREKKIDEDVFTEEASNGSTNDSNKS
ncbi:BCCT family transporter [Salibacterium halotolerans]|uniref:Glycine betaine transporter n=1 Tax=Salibacterium halotolerans TaxID=1884432 RepID=A0A1I5R4J1_9BACI|nr:BCCT family transporter [Salibacterium halotolerans]SFP52966.1 glycine betaine transporter [Salibacterium halotolerans]